MVSLLFNCSPEGFPASRLFNPWSLLVCTMHILWNSSVSSKDSKGIGKSCFLLFVMWKLINYLKSTQNTYYIAFQFKASLLESPLYAIWESDTLIVTEDVPEEKELLFYINDAVGITSEDLNHILKKCSKLY